MKYTVETKNSTMFEAIVTDNKRGTRNIYYQGTRDTAMWICAAMNNYERTIPMQKFIEAEESIRAAVRP